MKRTQSMLATTMRATCVASVVALGYAATVLPATRNAPYQSPESFEAAIRDESTSPVYVLITVVDDTSGRSKTGCTTGNLLLGAIHMQYGLAYDMAGVASARNSALTNTSHVFHFSKAEALTNVAFRYSPRDMEVARTRVRSMSDQRLREGLGPRGELQSSSDAEHDANACALVERGLWVRMADRSGELMLVQ
ncbi:MAG TPA: hypothetical protein VGM84_15060 [Steroidobacteraceae bacterium]|jgi:hypothetical protein